MKVSWQYLEFSRTQPFLANTLILHKFKVWSKYLHILEGWIFFLIDSPPSLDLDEDFIRIS